MASWFSVCIDSFMLCLGHIATVISSTAWPSSFSIVLNLGQQLVNSNSFKGSDKKIKNPHYMFW